MSLRQLFSLNRHSTTDHASDRPPTYVTNVEPQPLYVDNRVPIGQVRTWSPRVSTSRRSVDSMYDSETEVEADPRRPNSTSFSNSQSENPSDHRATTRYLYYRLYNKDGDMPSKASFDPQEPSLGRIRVDSVSPPHTPVSIKRCIGRVERRPGLIFGDLYATRSSTAPMKQSSIVSLLVGDSPGLTQDRPMALVQTLVRIQAISNSDSDESRKYLSHSIGDIFFTDAVVRGSKFIDSRPYYYDSTNSVTPPRKGLQLFSKSCKFQARPCNYYEATNYAGRKGRVLAERFNFLDSI